MSQLIIHGSRPTENFTINPNQVVYNLDLCSTARSILAYMLGVPEFKVDGSRWNICQEILYKHFPHDSKHRLRKALKRLNDLGYLAYEYVRDQSNRHITTRLWHVRLDRIMTATNLCVGSKHEAQQHETKASHNKIDTNQTEFNKTESVPASPPQQSGKPESLDLDQSVIPEPQAPKAINPLLSRVERLKSIAATSSTYQAALKKREQADAAFQAMLLKGQSVQQQATQALTAAYTHLTPAQTVDALCREHIANPKPRLDAPNRAKLTQWLQNGGGLLSLIDAFKQAQQVQSKTAKYVVKILAT